MRTVRQQLGERSERLAVELLTAEGYRVERANVRFPIGEIDLIAWDGQTLCFVEVRSASSEAWGGAAASITEPKRRRLIQAAQWYLQRLRQVPAEIRFDVVAVSWARAERPKAELIRGAFEAQGAW